RTFVAGSAAFLMDAGVGAFRLYSTAIDCKALADDLAGVAAPAVCRAVVAGGDLFVTTEQMPNPESRVMLSDQTDAFGDPRARLAWHITDGDMRTLREACLELGRWLIRAKLGRLRVNPAILDGAAPLAGWSSLPSALGAAGHQMGGLRMGRSAA